MIKLSITIECRQSNAARKRLAINDILEANRALEVCILGDEAQG